MTKDKLIDKQGRIVNYLRLAVTDRCNLRCFYCMPENGIQYAPRADLLTFEEIIRIVKLLSIHGVNKIRITGGEPFLRKDLLGLLQSIRSIDDIDQIHITSNGTLLKNHIDMLEDLDIRSINLSLDTLDTQRFYQISRRKGLQDILNVLYLMVERNFKVKINMVVMGGINDQDIVPMAMLSKSLNVDVRFIEEMPFNGFRKVSMDDYYNHIKIQAALTEAFPELLPIPSKAGATSQNFQIPGHLGKVGIIAAYSRSFCGSCNRIRLTPQGDLKTCLYDRGVFNIRDLIRAGASDQELLSAIWDAIAHKAKDGFEAEKAGRDNAFYESMSTIGG